MAPHSNLIAIPQPRRDAYGLPVTVASPAALEAYDSGVDRFLTWSREALEAFQQAVALDPDFGLGWAMASVALFLGERLPEARTAMARAERLAPHLTPREARHIRALALSVGGQAAEAEMLIRETLSDTPRDVVLLSRLFFLYFWQGRRAEMLRLTGSFIDQYDRASYVQGLHAFALEENEFYEPALRLGSAAVERNPRDAWAVHAVAHVLYEQGENQLGMDFLPRAVDRCDRLGPFRMHLQWHLALFLLEAGRDKDALELCSTEISLGERPVASELNDVISLLWRLERYGHDIRAAWGNLPPIARQRLEEPGTLFHQLMLALALLRSGDDVGSERLLDLLRARATIETGSDRLRQVALPLIEGLLAYCRGDYAGAAARLAPIEDRVVEIGGSHAQREVFYDTLLESYLRTGQDEPARSILLRRLEHRPSAARCWFRLGRLHLSEGRAGEARSSLEKVLQFWPAGVADGPERQLAQQLLVETV